MKQNFIRTTDKNTADKLSSLGFKKIQYTNGMYLFLNSSLKFTEEIDLSKIKYTNIMQV